MSIHRPLHPSRTGLATLVGVILAIALGVALVTHSTRLSGSLSQPLASGQGLRSDSGSGSAGPTYAPAVNRPVPIIHMPAGGSYSQKLPLVIALHGGSQTPSIMESSSELDQVADARGFIVAYLGSPPPEWQHSNDLPYIGAMINYLKSHLNVDPARVYVVGFSLGGYATFRAVCQYSDELAGIAIVSQVMAPLWRRPCSLSRPVSELSIVGSRDAVPVHAGNSTPSSADQTAAIWRRLNGCASPHGTLQSGPTTQTVWSRCTNGTSVGEYIVQGGTHMWPVYRPDLASTSPDYRYAASAAIWRFLSPVRLSPAAIAAQLLSISVRGRAAHRALVATVSAAESLSFKQTVRRGRRLVVGKRYHLHAARRVRVALRLPEQLTPGRYTVSVSATDSYGRMLRAVRTIRVGG